MVLWFNGSGFILSLTQLLHASLIQRFKGIIVLWFNGSLIPCLSGSVVLWFDGNSVVQWFSGSPVQSSKSNNASRFLHNYGPMTTLSNSK